MSGLNGGARAFERVAGLARPPGEEVQNLARSRRPEALRLKDDGFAPNHPFWPLLLYREAVRLPNELDPASVVETLFAKNGWGRAWRNGIYSYTHYHSQTHEALGVARGSAKVQFGGDKGPILEVKAGDVAVLPAGTGHKRIEASEDFLVVGAYPAEGKYDECASPDDHERALATIANTPRPASDPVYGADGPLLGVWA